MGNWWTRFGCFLIGYNYRIVKNSSEVAAKAVKRYTSAMLIICILWAFIGYTFTHRYLQGNIWQSIFGGVIAVFAIVQIERQIILSIKPGKSVYLFRTGLAIMMALIGALIIDQIILRQDIELEKVSYIGKRVDETLPSKTVELQNQIRGLDTTINAKEIERQAVIDEVTSKPFIKNVTSTQQKIPVQTSKLDTASGNLIPITELKTSTTVQISNSPNPKQALLAPLDIMISDMRKQKNVKENALLNIRPALEEEIKSKIGLLDELKVMYSLISGSRIALCFWSLWVLFLLFIELLVLFSKRGDKENDYEKTILHQMNLHIRKLDALEKIANGK